MEALGGGIEFFGGAGLQNDAELVAGITADFVTAAQRTAQTCGDDADNLVGDLKAVCPVQMPEIAEACEHEHRRALLWPLLPRATRQQTFCCARELSRIS